MSFPTLTIAQMLESGGPGGAETLVFQLSNELISRGHRIVPIRYQDGERWLDDKYRERGLEPVYLPLRRAVDFKAPKVLREILTSHGVDLVHSHEFTMAVYGAAATRGSSIPHVITMHGNQTMLEAWRRRVALRWAFRRSAGVVAVSTATRSHLEARLGLPANSLHTIPNGVPYRPGNAAGPEEEFGISPGEVVILGVGNLVERKGHIVLLRALAQLLEEGLSVPWRVIIAGRGEQRSVLEEFAEEAGFRDRVHLPGHRDDIPDLQAAADIVCMPSLWEGLPLAAVLEGMHAGNCIVASRTSGIPEAIDHGEQGLLVEPGDVASLASALRQVVEDGELRERLGDSALRRARDEFSVAGMADRYLDLYRRG